MFVKDFGLFFIRFFYFYFMEFSNGYVICFGYLYVDGIDICYFLVDLTVNILFVVLFFFCYEIGNVFYGVFFIC